MKNRCNRTAVSRNVELRRLVDRPRDSLFGVLGGSSANRWRAKKKREKRCWCLHKGLIPHTHTHTRDGAVDGPLDRRHWSRWFMNHATLDKYLVQVSQQPRGQPLTMSPLCATRVCVWRAFSRERPLLSRNETRPLADARHFEFVTWKQMDEELQSVRLM